MFLTLVVEVPLFLTFFLFLSFFPPPEAAPGTDMDDLSGCVVPVRDGEAAATGCGDCGEADSAGRDFDVGRCLVCFLV